MRLRTLTGACLLAASALLFGQPATGILAGRISYPAGSAVSHAPIQVTNKTTGATARTFSDNDGRYILRNLAPGDYDFSIVMPCCAYARVTNKVLINPGQTTTLDASLVETINGSTLGDDPARLADAMRNRAKVPARPAPRTSAGVPDLSGIWLETDDPYPEQPEVLPATTARMKQLDLDPRSPPHHRCLPGPPPIPGAASPFIGKIVQTPALLVILFEDYPGFRQVFLDGRKHPGSWNPTWMGHSIGHWEKDVLVVDTVGFNDEGLIAGIGGGRFPHSEALHMTERYRRTDFGHMELSVTFEDSNAFARPFHENRTLSLAPQEELMEYVCENNKSEHYVK